MQKYTPQIIDDYGIHIPPYIKTPKIIDEDVYQNYDTTVDFEENDPKVFYQVDNTNNCFNKFISCCWSCLFLGTSYGV